MASSATQCPTIIPLGSLISALQAQLALRASRHQVGQRLLVPTHVFGDAVKACDKDKAVWAAAAWSPSRADSVGSGLMCAVPGLCERLATCSTTCYLHQAPSNFVFDGIVRRRTRGRADRVDARVCVKKARPPRSKSCGPKRLK